MTVKYSLMLLNRIKIKNIKKNTTQNLKITTPHNHTTQEGLEKKGILFEVRNNSNKNVNKC